MTNRDTFPLVIVGAGASGLAAAVCAGKSALVLERNPRAGKKILATGNGRCNLGNTRALEHPYHNRAFALPALRRFDVQGFFRSLGLLTRADAEGRLYPRSNTAASVLDALRFGAARAGAQVLCDTPALSIAAARGGFAVETPGGVLLARRVIIAAGGCVAPGGDGSGFALLRGLGHAIVEPRPALVQIVCQSPLLPMLKGLRCFAGVRIEDPGGRELAAAEGEILFAQDGLSGIAAMEVSRCAQPGTLAVLDLAPEYKQLRPLLEELSRACPEQSPSGLLAGLLPRRIGEAVLKQAAGGDLAAALKRFVFPVTGVRGFAHAQVTAGGAVVSEFHPETLESRLAPGLYACGEALDVDGGCGGFNLQWAWASGALAGALAA
ncbi:MAG: aminoacetone oxidase family FAD-binding enzyme [Oscillospiraceae bacterium]|nr:aminoacetone oxidase family FAD-binding enzyme [Oscillospiraceae bacterium]